MQNQAKVIIACDFMFSVTASMRVLYDFVAMEIGSRRILHTNVTAHPNAEWTLQQFRESLAFDHSYQIVIHDCDAICPTGLDSELRGFGLRVLKTPVRAPTANTHWERMIGMMRRECLDYLIPINERHLKLIINEFTTHHNRGPPTLRAGARMPARDADILAKSATTKSMV